MRACHRFVFVVLLAVVTSCAPLVRASAPPHHFLERSHVFKPPGDTLLYEAHPAAHLFLLDGLPLAYDQITRIDTATKQPRRTTHALRVIVSPMFRLRQLKDSSAAVRTPSFMPRLAVERIWVAGLGTPTVVGSNVTYHRFRLTGARLTLTHHSNGQAGCFREGYRFTDSTAKECAPIPLAERPRDTMQVKLNHADGDFSSTYVSGIVHMTFMGDSSSGDTPRYLWGAAVGYDWHAQGLFGELSDAQRKLYGSWRVRGRMEGMIASGLGCGVTKKTLAGHVACAVKGRSRVTLEGEFGPQAKGPLAPRFEPAIVRWRGSVEVSHAFDWLLGAGVFIRWHDGQDYYNIGFDHRLRATMFGVMLDASGPDRVRKRDATG